MKRPTLDKKESETYMLIVTKGNMDDMFDFGYAVGRERLALEMLNDSVETQYDKAISMAYVEAQNDTNV